jgi:hypothetical protein
MFEERSSEVTTPGTRAREWMNAGRWLQRHMVVAKYLGNNTKILRNKAERTGMERRRSMVRHSTSEVRMKTTAMATDCLSS